MDWVGRVDKIPSVYAGVKEVAHGVISLPKHVPSILVFNLFTGGSRLSRRWRICRGRDLRSFSFFDSPNRHTRNVISTFYCALAEQNNSRFNTTLRYLYGSARINLH